MEHLFSDGSLSFTGQNVECVPPWLSSKYGENITTRVDLSYNRIRSLKGLVGFPNVKELVLDNNQLSDDVEFPLMTSVETLTVNKNNITNIELFLQKIVDNLPNLTYLSMLGNPACPSPISHPDKDESDYIRYRYYVLHWIPSLKFLDSTPVTAQERSEAKRVGGFMKTVQCEITKDSSEETRGKTSQYGGLPSTEPREGNHQSSYGKCRYIYYGKHSEGNRFIVNNDL